jgi:NADPH-dependent ferric siderophore reductase
VARVLLAADETALPALAAILETLAAQPRPPIVQAFIEAPAGVIDLPAWSGLDLTWLERAPEAYPGDAMLQAVRRACLPVRVSPLATAALSAVDIDRDILWNQAAAADDGFYAWVAGEAAAVLAIRAFLITERRLDRGSINLMGYWRMGRALDDAPARA